MSKKIKLDLDHLSVESFSTSPDGSRGSGTVEGYQTQYNDTCGTVGQCGGGTVTNYLSCGCPTEGCTGYPTWYNECNETVTYGENTCYCDVPMTDAQYCNTERDCTGDGGMC